MITFETIIRDIENSPAPDGLPSLLRQLATISLTRFGSRGNTARLLNVVAARVEREFTPNEKCALQRDHEPSS